MTAASVEHNGVVKNSKQLAGFYLTEITYAPRISVPTHSHRYVCFCFVLEGGYTERYRSKILDCRPTQLIFRPAAERHSDHFGTQEVRCFIVETEEEWLKCLEKRSIHLNAPHTLQSPTLCWLGMRLRSESRQPDDLTSVTIEGLMLELGAEVGRVLKPSVTRPPRWLNQTREMLHENFARNISLAEIAASADVHPVYLCTVFRRQYHCTVGEYVRRLRVEFASSELSKSDSSLADIALRAGFSHQSHFTRTFKRVTGLTPEQYRSAHR